MHQIICMHIEYSMFLKNNFIQLKYLNCLHLRQLIEHSKIFAILLLYMFFFSHKKFVSSFGISLHFVYLYVHMQCLSVIQ